MRKIAFISILISVLITSCNNSNLNLNLSTKQIETLDKIQKRYQAQRIELDKVTDFDSNKKIDNSILINILNSKIVDIQSVDLKKYCEDVLVEFIKSSLPNLKYDLIEIRFCKGTDIKIYHKWDSKGGRYASDIIDNVLGQLNSPRYKLEQAFLICESENDYDSLITLANELLDSNPDISEALKFRGFAFYKLKEYDKAERDFSQARKLNDTDIDIPMNLAILFGDKREYKKGLTYIDTVLNIQPEYPKAFYFRGIYKLNLGDKENGLIDLKRAEKLGVSEASSYLVLENKK